MITVVFIGWGLTQPNPTLTTPYYCNHNASGLRWYNPTGEHTPSTGCVC